MEEVEVPLAPARPFVEEIFVELRTAPVAPELCREVEDWPVFEEFRTVEVTLEVPMLSFLLLGSGGGRSTGTVEGRG